MGRRRKKKVPRKKKNSIEPLQTLFMCPFCNHLKSCEVKMDFVRKVARIYCSVCSEQFQSKINCLSEAIDVYNEWIDACELVN